MESSNKVFLTFAVFPVNVYPPESGSDVNVWMVSPFFSLEFNPSNITFPDVGLDFVNAFVTFATLPELKDSVPNKNSPPEVNVSSNVSPVVDSRSTVVLMKARPGDLSC